MFQSWRRLLFLHWEIAPEEIAETLPRGLVPHLYGGRAYLGIVPFFMRNIRPRGLPAVPWISHFLEMNVRTYVLGPDGVPGVWFYSLDTDRRIARMLGRGLFHLPYFDAEMRAPVAEDGSVHYSARRIGQNSEANFSYRAAGDFSPAAPGTLEEFLLERYSLFSWNPRRGRIHRGRVHHCPYEFAVADVSEWSSAPARWNGLPVADSPPLHACMARDVEVSVYALEEV
jgi:uncharacterized protein YqjF (DUF2071 family)